MTPQTHAVKAEMPRALPSLHTREALPPKTVIPARTWVAVAVVAGAVITLGWAGVHFLRNPGGPDTHAANPPEELTQQAPAAVAPDATQPHANPPVGDPPEPLTVHQVIPDVPKSASRTIRGHIKISVRAIVAADGTVSAVIANRGGPSKYFQRLAEEATKKWTFTPSHAATPRVAQVQFDFSRDATTGHAVLVH